MQVRGWITGATAGRRLLLHLHVFRHTPTQCNRMQKRLQSRSLASPSLWTPPCQSFCNVYVICNVTLTFICLYGFYSFVIRDKEERGGCPTPNSHHHLMIAEREEGAGPERLSQGDKRD